MNLQLFWINAKLENVAYWNAVEANVSIQIIDIKVNYEILIHSLRWLWLYQDYLAN